MFSEASAYRSRKAEPRRLERWEEEEEQQGMLVTKIAKINWSRPCERSLASITLYGSRKLEAAAFPYLQSQRSHFRSANEVHNPVRLRVQRQVAATDTRLYTHSRPCTCSTFCLLLVCC